MNDGNKNVFEETVKTLTQDATSLQRRFHMLQEKNDFRGALDSMRLLKDTLSLIKEYDWELKYSECGYDERKEVAIWEQNHSGEIRNYKKWIVNNSTKIVSNKWYDMFEDYITSSKSCIVNDGNLHRNTGKSYALAKLCNEYDGIVVYKNHFSCRGIEQVDMELKIVNTFVPYRRNMMNFRQYRDKIVFIDEGAGLFEDEIKELDKNNVVIGFR